MEDEDLDKYRRDYDLYISAISKDPVATVLRFHLLTEYYLEQTIRIILPRGDRIIDSGHFTYAQKLTIVAALDVYKDELISSLKNLNKLRNKCSHEFNSKITYSDIGKIGSPFGKEWTEIKNKKNKVSSQLSHLFGLISIEFSVELERIEKEFHGDSN